jgi:hypothetical protein
MVHWGWKKWWNLGNGFVMKILNGILHLLHCLDYMLFVILFTLGLKIITNDITHVLDYVNFDFLWCLWVFTIWQIHTKNLGDMCENHVGTLLQWRIGPSWCIVVMKNLCLVKVLGVGNYWSWKIIWNLVQLWVSFMFV